MRGHIGIRPLGAPLRLKASCVIPEMVSAGVRVILQAMERSGMLLTGHGSEWYVSGCPYELWNNEIDAIDRNSKDAHGGCARSGRYPQG